LKTTDIPAVARLLKREYLKHHAPVVEFVHAQTRDPFKVLVATILSARTRDETTTAAVGRLFPAVGNMETLKRTSRARIEKLIFPVGFYRTKAKHLKELPAVLDREFGGRIPDTVEELCRLPGVGRKTANLVVAVAFNKPAICVDVHVHRICNRLGLLTTKTPFETEMRLRRILPMLHWIAWNAHLVSYGQTICNPTRPWCSRCVISRYCDKTGVTKMR
jgi:endonuclease III